MNKFRITYTESFVDNGQTIYSKSKFVDRGNLDSYFDLLDEFEDDAKNSTDHDKVYIVDCGADDKRLLFIPDYNKETYFEKEIKWERFEDEEIDLPF